MPCCQPNGTACSLEGGEWCNCAAYPKQAPLFPPLKTRSYVNETCVEREANEDQEEVDLDSDGNGAYFAMRVTTVALAVAVVSVVVL